MEIPSGGNSRFQFPQSLDRSGLAFWFVNFVDALNTHGDWIFYGIEWTQYKYFIHIIDISNSDSREDVSWLIKSQPAFGMAIAILIAFKGWLWIK